MPGAGERWPPVYDLEDLVNEIGRMTKDERLERDFYEWRLDRSTLNPSDVCQGDVVLLDSEVPVILENGQPGLVEHPEHHWLVIGNTCDFDRSIEEAPWTQLVPIVSVGPDKRVLQGATKVATLQARMSRGAWILLNACLVRFLARDDGRYDA